MDNIIFICTGNTCRSPMAEGLFRAHGGDLETYRRAAAQIDEGVRSIIGRLGA